MKILLAKGLRKFKRSNSTEAKNLDHHHLHEYPTF